MESTRRSVSLSTLLWAGIFGGLISGLVKLGWENIYNPDGTEKSYQPTPNAVATNWDP